MGGKRRYSKTGKFRLVIVVVVCLLLVLTVIPGGIGSDGKEQNMTTRTPEDGYRGGLPVMIFDKRESAKSSCRLLMTMK